MGGDPALERRNAELSARVEELTRRLAQNEAVTHLAAGTVHDLRNVFSVVLMAGESMLHMFLGSEARDLAQTIVSAAEHGTFLSQDLLTLARRSHAREIDPHELLRKLRRMIDRIVMKRFECKFEVSPHVEMFTADCAQLEAALINLSVNARDAMPDGGLLTIHVTSLPEDGPVPSGLAPNRYVQFAVRDTGHGMSHEVLSHATEAFYTTKESSGGTGLGLAVSHAFAVRSGGALLIESEQGRGTCVRLILPRGEAKSDLTAGGDRRLEKIMSRIRDPGLRRALITWAAARPATGLPQPVALEASLSDFSDSSLTLSHVPGTEPRALRVLRVGRRLAAALSLQPIGDLLVDGSVQVGSLEAAYRRALLSGVPSYEYARYSLSSGAPSAFERLILPASADATHVTHLIGVVQLSPDLDLQSGGDVEHA